MGGGLFHNSKPSADNCDPENNKKSNLEQAVKYTDQDEKSHFTVSDDYYSGENLEKFSKDALGSRESNGLEVNTFKEKQTLGVWWMLFRLWRVMKIWNKLKKWNKLNKFNKWKKKKKKGDKFDDLPKKVPGRYSHEDIVSKCKGKKGWCKDYMDCLHNTEDILDIFSELADTDEVKLSKEKEESVMKECMEKENNEETCKEALTAVKSDILYEQLVERLENGNESSGRSDDDLDDSDVIMIIVGSIAAVIILIVCAFGFFYFWKSHQKDPSKGKSSRGGKKSRGKSLGLKSRLRSKGSPKSGKSLGLKSRLRSKGLPKSSQNSNKSNQKSSRKKLRKSLLY